MGERSGKQSDLLRRRERPNRCNPDLGAETLTLQTDKLSLDQDRSAEKAFERVLESRRIDGEYATTGIERKWETEACAGSGVLLPFMKSTSPALFRFGSRTIPVGIREYADSCPIASLLCPSAWKNGPGNQRRRC